MASTPDEWIYKLPEPLNIKAGETAAIDIPCCLECGVVWTDGHTCTPA